MAFGTTNHRALGGAFRVKIDFKRELRRSKQRIEHRLRDREWSPQDQPMFTARNIHYELSSRDRGITAGGLGAVSQMAQQRWPAHASDDPLQLLKEHLPYSAADHVLKAYYNPLSPPNCTADAKP